MQERPEEPTSGKEPAKPSAEPDPLTQEEMTKRALMQPEFYSIIEQGVKASATRLTAEEVKAKTLQAIEDAAAYLSDPSSPEYDKLKECNRMSKVQAIAKLASIGLTANRRSGTGFIVPRFDRELRIMVAQATPGVRGMERLVAPHIKCIYNSLIRRQDKEHEQIDSNTGMPYIVVSRNLRPDPSKANDIIGVVANITCNDGTIISKLLPVKVCEEIQNGRTVQTAYIEGRRMPVAPGFMGMEKALEMAARRAVLREFIFTKQHGIAELAEAAKLEADAYAGLDDDPAAITALEMGSPGAEAQPSNAAPPVGQIEETEPNLPTAAKQSTKNPLAEALSRVGKASVESIEGGISA
jgi:recombinational DNA repair protein RecT